MKITVKDVLPSKGEKNFMLRSLKLTVIALILFNVTALILVYGIELQPPKLFMANWMSPFIWCIFCLITGGMNGVPKSP